jgi:hypothetical protein
LKINEAESALRQEIAAWDEENDKAIGILRSGLRKQSGAMQSVLCYLTVIRQKPFFVGGPSGFIFKE